MTAEFLARHAEFEVAQKAGADAAYVALAAQDAFFLDSYVRLTSFQAWRGYLFSHIMPPDVLSFYVEAQNDGLISHLLARQGMWRPSLQSLRSCLENILVCHYYLDHPVELALWKLGKHRMGFTELLGYFDAHPNFRDFAEPNLTGLSLLKEEYSDLSKAVHGSSATFMMGNEATMPNVFVAEVKSVGQWNTRQKKTIEALNLLMLTFHRQKLIGTSYPSLRKAVSGVITLAHAAKIKSIYQISLKR